LCSCGVSVKSAGAPGSASEEAGPAYRLAFPPARIRVHPLSRIVGLGEGGRRRIEAHVEVLDSYQHLVKGLGEFRFEVAQLDGSPLLLPEGSRLQWRIDASDPRGASSSFDPVTRTYRFVLTELPRELGRRGLLLRVMFTPTEGERLSAERVVESAPVSP